ncbi:unnamed protein product [Heterobilharzia americana]|nr:unnamed protein product [Heterobilharzia americana]CAH8502986.1 unnamed protein product [Heterobilharzia americana]
MLNSQYCIQTTCSEYLICAFIIICSISHAQCQHDSVNNSYNNNNEINSSLNKITVVESPSNFELIRMKKEAENTPEDNHIDIEHIERHSIESLRDHLKLLSKMNYNDGDNNKNNVNILLKSLSNFDEINYKFQSGKSTNEGSTTFTFIEMIVQRTVNKYMNVIRTRSDWLKRLLQLVKEERDIRSRYNCYTDACIYKIQLFTTQLKAHLLRNTVHHMEQNRGDDDLHLRRIRRSVPDKSSSSLFNMNDSTIEILSDNPEIRNLLVIQEEEDDDALRLPDELHKLNLLKHPEDDDFVNWTNSNGSRQKTVNFEDANKIDVARFSQELIGDVLSKHTKGQTVTSSTLNTFDLTTNSDNNNTTDSIDSSSLSTTNPQPPQNTFGNSPLNGDSNSYLDNLEQNEETDLEDIPGKNDVESSGNTTEKDFDISLHESDDPLEKDHVKEESIRSKKFIETENNLPLSSSESLPSSTYEAIAFTNDTPVSFTEPVPTSNPVDSVPSELSDNTIPPPTLNTEDIKQSEIYRYSIKPSLNIRAISLTMEETLAIPFGLNKFDGRPYENCTGQYENYCYNAIKCVYISVLETAACYCRTGYTGVRCDMFNLPQTLDILKSFREESIDINSLHQPTAYILHNVIEATARYTVNAVLEESLLSTWEDETPF